MGKVRGAAHRRMNIFLAFPTYDHKVDVEIMMMAAQLPPLYPQHQFQIDFIAGSILTGGRNYLVRNFLKSDSEWLLFWDSEGFVLYYKRLERGTFSWLDDLDLSEGGEMEASDFAIILAGVNPVSVPAQKKEHKKTNALPPRVAPLQLV